MNMLGTNEKQSLTKEKKYKELPRNFRTEKYNNENLTTKILNG